MYIRSASKPLALAVGKPKWHILLEDNVSICGNIFLFATEKATNVSKEDICPKCKK